LNLNLHFISNLGGVTSASNRFKTASASLNKTNAKTSGGIKKWSKENRKLNNTLSNLNKDANRARNSFKGLGASAGLAKRALMGLNVYMLGRGISKSIQANIDMIETINLFEVAMGRFAETTQVAIERISTLSGMDVTNLQNKVGTFNLLARSMGISSEKASILSENVTVLSMDLASLTNTSLQQVAEDLRSGLIGQSRTLYKYGIDATEAGIATEALAQGITKSVRNMTQGEKMALRYSVIIRQAGLSHGDFAKTIMYPANQLRILSERIVTLSRAIGSVFIPMLSAVLPYINAFVLALTRIMWAIGAFFGFVKTEVKNTDNDNFLGIPDGAESAEDAVGGASKAVKKLQGQLLGFDEINILKDPAEDSGGGGGGGGGVGGGTSPLDMEFPALSDSIGKLKDIASELADKIQPKLEFILELIGLIAIGFLSWKIANGVLAILTAPSLGVGLMGILKALGVVAESGAINTFGVLLGIVAIMVTRFIDLYRNSELFRDGLKAVWEMGKWAFEELIEFGGKVASAIGSMLPESVKDWFVKVGEKLSILDIDFADFLITLAGIGLLFTPFGAFGIVLLTFELITVALRLLADVSKEASGEFDLLAGVSEEVTAKLQPFIDKTIELDNQLQSINWGGMVIDDETIASISSKLKEVTKMILAELDADQNTSLKNLEPLRDALGEEAYKKLVLANKEYYTKTKKSIADDEQAILDIIKEAQDNGEGMTDEYLQRIQEITDRMSKTGIDHLGDAEISYMAIMTRLKDNSIRVSLEQAEAIITDSLRTKDETIKNAELQYAGQLLSAQQMLDVGAINEEEYDVMIKASKKAKDETVANANEQYDNIRDATELKLGETAEKFDFATNTIKEGWKIFLIDLNQNFNEKSDEMVENVRLWGEGMDKKTEEFKAKMKIGWVNFWTGLASDIDESSTTMAGKMAEWGKKMDDGTAKAMKLVKETFERTWIGIKKFFIGIINNIIETLEKGINFIGDGLNGLITKFNSVTAKLPFGLGGKIEVTKISETYLGRVPDLFADGGMPTAGQMFIAREAGAELVGNINGRTGVVNNDQIVQAVSAGVYQAVSSAISVSGAGKGGNQPIILNIDGKEFARMMLPKVDGEAQRLGFKTLLSY